jgi:hypothetical protein
MKKEGIEGSMGAPAEVVADGTETLRVSTVDDLRTPSESRLAEREQEFIKNGAFEKLVDLKVFLGPDLLQDDRGISSRSGGGSLTFYHDIETDPMTYAVACLGFGHNDKEIDPKVLEERKLKYLEDVKPDLFSRIEHSRELFVATAIRLGLNLTVPVGILEDMRNNAVKNEWEEFGQNGIEYGGFGKRSRRVRC